MNELKLNEQQHCSWSTSVKIIDLLKLMWQTCFELVHSDSVFTRPLLFSTFIIYRDDSRLSSRLSPNKSIISTCCRWLVSFRRNWTNWAHTERNLLVPTKLLKKNQNYIPTLFVIRFLSEFLTIKSAIKVLFQFLVPISLNPQYTIHRNCAENANFWHFWSSLERPSEPKFSDIERLQLKLTFDPASVLGFGNWHSSFLMQALKRR